MALASAAPVGPPIDASVCRDCGACCSYSSTWPRFTLESDADIARIAGRYVADDHSGMRCAGDRCSALVGKIGVHTSCAIYAVRPDVCRACEPGDDACSMARDKIGLGPISAG